MPPIKNEPLNCTGSALHYCCSHRFKGEGEGNVQVGIALLQRPVVRGSCPPQTCAFNITCGHHASSEPHPAPRLWFGIVWFGCTAVFGQLVLLSNVVMEEVCCKLVRCRRRASSVTLPLPWSKLVSLDNQKVEYILGQRGWACFSFNSANWLKYACFFFFFFFICPTCFVRHHYIKSYNDVNVCMW